MQPTLEAVLALASYPGITKDELKTRALSLTANRFNDVIVTLLSILQDHLTNDVDIHVLLTKVENYYNTDSDTPVKLSSSMIMRSSSAGDTVSDMIRNRDETLFAKDGTLWMPAESSYTDKWAILTTEEKFTVWAYLNILISLAEVWTHLSSN
jgi:hypothetical protein